MRSEIYEHQKTTSVAGIIIQRGFFSLAIICFLCSGLRAQQPELGIKGGLNVANISHLSGDDRISANLGLFVHIRLNRNWCLQPELLFSGEGQRFWEAGLQYTQAMNYIRVPFMFQYFPARQVYLEFGPQLGFLASAKIRGDDGYKLNVYHDYNKTDVGLNLGIGVNATRRLGFNFRYCIGLSDITPNDNYTYSNLVAQLGATYRIN